MGFWPIQPKFSKSKKPDFFYVLDNFKIFVFSDFWCVFFDLVLFSKSVVLFSK